MFLLRNPTIHNAIQAGPREGVFVKGLLLEGASWDMDFATLVDAPPMKVCALAQCVLFVCLAQRGCLRTAVFTDVDQDAHHSHEAHRIKEEDAQGNLQLPLLRLPRSPRQSRNAVLRNELRVEGDAHPHPDCAALFTH
jgi:hypothetical protein